MRVWLLLALLLAAGCLEGGGPAGGKPASSTPVTTSPASTTPLSPTPPTPEQTGGPVNNTAAWRVTWNVTEVFGAWGDEREFSGVLERGWSSDRAFVNVVVPFATLDEPAWNGANGIAPGERRVELRGRLVVGGADRIVMQVGSWNGTDVSRDTAYAWIEGPRVVMRDVGGANVSARAASDVVDVPANLSVRVEGARVIATYASKEVATNSCMERIHPQGDWRMRAEGNRTVLVGFVIQEDNDACTSIPAERTRVVATTPELPPGEVVVRVFALRQCFCPPGMPYAAREATVRVG